MMGAGGLGATALTCLEGEGSGSSLKPMDGSTKARGPLPVRLLLFSPRTLLFQAKRQEPHCQGKYPKKGMICFWTKPLRLTREPRSSPHFGQVTLGSAPATEAELGIVCPDLGFIGTVVLC